METYVKSLGNPIQELFHSRLLVLRGFSRIVLSSSRRSANIGQIGNWHHAFHPIPMMHHRPAASAATGKLNRPPPPTAKQEKQERKKRRRRSGQQKRKLPLRRATAARRTLFFLPLSSAVRLLLLHERHFARQWKQITYGTARRGETESPFPRHTSLGKPHFLALSPTLETRRVCLLRSLSLYKS